LGAATRSLLDRLHDGLTEALPGNRFLARKLAGFDPADLRSPEAFAQLPFTTKAELAADQAENPPYGTNLSFPQSRYVRLHQTSGTTTGRPMRWLDTAESWAWAVGCWRTCLTDGVGLVPGRDRLFFPFSFGPFYGFWTAFEAATAAGFLALSGGGMPTSARVRFLLDHGATAVFATPTYALHLAEAAAAEGFDLPGSAVRAVVVAGEPGGGVPASRERIERLWGASVYDQYGLTEVGPTATERTGDPGALHLLAGEYIAEVVEPEGTAPVRPGEVGELVLTNLGRWGSPAVRYRTGDLVREAGPGRWAAGVLGRTDDMIHVRGNNVYPTAIEAVVRRFPEVAEFRVVVDQTGPLADLRIEVESDGSPAAGLAEAVSRAVRDELLFRADVVAVPPGTLPRFEMKARRVVRIS
jgi:phenylacetate-CoA ligase